MYPASYTVGYKYYTITLMLLQSNHVLNKIPCVVSPLDLMAGTDVFCFLSVCLKSSDWGKGWRETLLTSSSELMLVLTDLDRLVEQNVNWSWVRLISFFINALIIWGYHTFIVCGKKSKSFLLILYIYFSQD